jgi:hypothetical protein
LAGLGFLECPGYLLWGHAGVEKAIGLGLHRRAREGEIRRSAKDHDGGVWDQCFELLHA